MATAPLDLTQQNIILDVLGIAGKTSQTIAGTGVVYTKHFALPRNVDFGLLTKVTSPGTVNFKIELEQGNTIPTDQAADSNGTWAVGQVVSAGIVATGAYALAVSPVVTQYGRFKITGLGSNDAATALTILQLAVSKKR